MSNLNLSVPVFGPGTPSAGGGVAMDPSRAASVAVRTEACDEAGAVAAAMQVFEEGLTRLMIGAADPAPGAIEDVTGLLAAIAGQTSLMALRASIEAVRDGAAGRGYTAAAADVRSLAGQMSRATETLVSQVGLIQAAAERAQDAAAAERRAGSAAA